MKRVAEMLRRETGLDAAALGPNVISRTLRGRMTALGLTDETNYCTHALANPAEWAELVEAAVVSETWFFRDPAAFRTFLDLYRQTAGRSQESAGGVTRSAFCVPSSELRPPPRILSAPCATGEEPYTIAMTLLDAGVPAENIALDALDLSQRALARARAGIYTRNAFRGDDLTYRERHFMVEKTNEEQPQAAGDEGGAKDTSFRVPRSASRLETAWRLHPRVRGCVNFFQGNLLAPVASSEFRAESASALNPQPSTIRPPYDFIFCRNLLIYQDQATQARTVGRLRELLAPEGVVFFGPAEVAIASRHGFTTLGVPLAFACRMRKAAGSRLNPEAGSRKPKTANQTAELSTLNPPASTIPRAAHFYALGQAQEAQRDAVGAVEQYRKALYLEPAHYASLARLAELLARAGDPAGRNYERRAARVAQQQPREPDRMKQTE